MQLILLEWEWIDLVFVFVEITYNELIFLSIKC